jgi:aspartate/tyrosine/aromatic aminotransferase
MNTNIQIEYIAGVHLDQDQITITIENTTYAALNVLNQDLKKLIKPTQGNETYTQEACRLLLEKLTQELDKKLNFNI